MIPLALAAPMAHAEDADYRSYLDQARFFVKRAWYADAASQLERAVATPDGRLDPEAWFFLASVRLELDDVAGARHAADRAMVHARDSDQAEQAAALLDYLNQTFGFVTLEAPRPGMASRVQIELQSILFDPELKNYVNDLVARRSGAVALPVTLGLPAGAYAINGAPVLVVPGQEHTLTPPILGGSGALQLLSVELGAGLTHWFGAPVAHLLPNPTTSVAVSLPLGPVVWGAVGQWAYTPYLTRAGALVGSAAGGSAGIRVGVEVPIGVGGAVPVALRPALGWRWQQLPGIELACASSGDAFRCGVEDVDVRQLVVHPTGGAHVPFAEIAARLTDRTRTQGFGGGMTLGGGYALGRIPSQATSTTLDGATYAWTAQDRAWNAFAIQVLADLTYAL